MSKTKSAIGLALGVVALIINIIVLAALGSAGSSAVNAAATVPAATVAAADPTTGPTVTAEPTAAGPDNRAPDRRAHHKGRTPGRQAHQHQAPTAKPVSAEEQNAIRSAQSYLEFSAFSRKGLIRQLSSDAGEGYSVKAATARGGLAAHQLQ